MQKIIKNLFANIKSYIVISFKKNLKNFVKLFRNFILIELSFPLVIIIISFLQQESFYTIEDFSAYLSKFYCYAFQINAGFFIFFWYVN